jgi:hypothetical protein
MKFPLRYLPKRLTAKDRKKQSRMLARSRRQYKQHRYQTRKKLSSFRSKPSPHVETAKRIYHVNHIGATPALAKASGCSQSALRQIIRKGKGAYFSSGSRPNQTAQSWGVARLASTLTSGKAAVVDYSILEKGCRPNSPALRRAKTAKRKFGHPLRRTPHT